MSFSFYKNKKVLVTGHTRFKGSWMCEVLLYGGAEVTWKNVHDGGTHEVNFLNLDYSKLKKTFGWKLVWNEETTMKKIVEWTNEWKRGFCMEDCMSKQIREFVNND